jgi:hypothetical protein
MRGSVALTGALFVPDDVVIGRPTVSVQHPANRTNGFAASGA